MVGVDFYKCFSTIIDKAKVKLEEVDLLVRSKRGALKIVLKEWFLSRVIDYGEQKSSV